MERWRLDVMGSSVLADGGELKAALRVEEHSRFWCAGLTRRAVSRAVLRPLCDHR